VTLSPGALLGGVWEALDWDTRLHSILFAEGSAAVVYEKESLFAEDLYGLGNAPVAAATIGRRSPAELPEPPEGRSP
jgi:3-oxoacyl-[acyl-carrier-protein] synthase III